METSERPNLLMDLETRHDDVLRELDALDQRITEALGEFQRERDAPLRRPGDDSIEVAGPVDRPQDA